AECEGPQTRPAGGRRRAAAPRERRAGSGAEAGLPAPLSRPRAPGRSRLRLRFPARRTGMSPIRRSILVALATALIATVAAPAGAQSTLETVKKRGKLIAGVKTDFPPFGTVDAAGKNVGFDVDVAHRFAKALFNEDKDVEQLQPKASRVKFGKVSEAVLALKGGRADAYVHDDIVILSLAKENADLKAVGKTFVPRPYGIAVRKGDTEFINWVNAELKKMHTDGTYDRLWKKYFADVEQFLIKP